MSPSKDAGRLPSLWAGRRRLDLALLVLTGVGQAAAAGLGAHLLLRILHGSMAGQSPVVVVALVGSAVGVGALRMAERILAERVSQDYVHEVRLGLVRASLAHDAVPNLGVAIARTTNDLTSVRNWITQGVVPLAVGIPFLLGAGVVLTLIGPLLALSLAVPIALLLVGLRRLGPTAYRRTRALRAARGRLSGLVADTILSTRAIRSAGGASREITRVSRLSGALAAAAVLRAKATGAQRGMAASASGLSTSGIVGAAMYAHLPATQIAAAFAVHGFAATPIHDLGRVAEARQTYLAALHIIGPAMAPAPVHVREPEAPATPSPQSGQRGRLSATDLTGKHGMPDLFARPGDRILVRTGSRIGDTRILDHVAGITRFAAGRVRISDVDIFGEGCHALGDLVGYGAQGMLLPRSSIARAVRYRATGASREGVDSMLQSVGLLGHVSQLPKGTATTLRHGGDPLTVPQRARLTLARALYGDPPVVVFDHLDADLGQEGRHTMQSVLRQYAGVVVLASDDPDQVMPVTHLWTPAGVKPQPGDPHPQSS